VAVVTNLRGGPRFDLAAPSGGMGVLAAPARYHARLLELLREPGRAAATRRSGRAAEAVWPAEQAG
jgi:hypothetical protein